MIAWSPYERDGPVSVIVNGAPSTGLAGSRATGKLLGQTETGAGVAVAGTGVPTFGLTTPSGTDEAGCGTIAAGGRRPPSLARSPPLAIVTCPALAQGRSVSHCW